MKKQVVFRNMKRLAELETYAKEQLVEFEDMVDEDEMPLSAELTLEESEARKCPKAVLRIRGEDYDFVSSCEYEGVEFHDVIDRVIDMMAELISDRHALRDEEEEEDELEGEDEDEESLEDEDEDEDEEDEE